MGDALLCYKINSKELTDLLEKNTNKNISDNRFGHSRQIRPENFGLDKGGYDGGFLYYADNGFPDVTDEALILVQTIGGQPPVNMPTPSKAQQLIQRVIGNSLRRNITTNGLSSDLSLHGYYLGDERKYIPASKLSSEFLQS